MYQFILTTIGIIILTINQANRASLTWHGAANSCSLIGNCSTRATEHSELGTQTCASNYTHLPCRTHFIQVTSPNWTTDQGTDFLAWQQQWLAYRSLSSLLRSAASSSPSTLLLQGNPKYVTRFGKTLCKVEICPSSSG